MTVAKGGLALHNSSVGLIPSGASAAVSLEKVVLTWNASVNIQQYKWIVCQII